MGGRRLGQQLTATSVTQAWDPLRSAHVPGLKDSLGMVLQAKATPEQDEDMARKRGLGHRQALGCSHRHTRGQVCTLANQTHRCNFHSCSSCVCLHIFTHSCTQACPCQHVHTHGHTLAHKCITPHAYSNSHSSPRSPMRAPDTAQEDRKVATAHHRPQLW